MQTFKELINNSMQLYPNKTAFIFEDKRYTYEQVNQRVNSLINALHSLGVKDVINSIRLKISKVKNFICLDATIRLPHFTDLVYTQKILHQYWITGKNYSEELLHN